MKMWKDLLLLLMFLCTSLAWSNVTVPLPFASHMVLQRQMAVPVWGTAAASEAVSVTFNGQTKTTTTTAAGTWRVSLDAMVAGGPYTMTVKGANTVTLTDIMVGEVWQCAGQSNMDTRMSYYPINADTITKTNIPNLRYYTERQPGVSGNTWQAVTPTSVGRLSALGFYFGGEIMKNTGVAVGLLVTAVGGTKVEQWMDPATVAAQGLTADTTAGNMYKAWIPQVAGFAMRGVVWFQGEQNTSSALYAYYAARFQAMIKGWRAIWGQGDFPFIYGQLANTHTAQTTASTPGAKSNYAEIREAQRLALVLPTTAMSVNLDIGVADSLHFPNKKEAGRRLALAARHMLYGETSLVASGPMYESMSIVGSTIHLHFNHTGSGLSTSDGNAPAGFVIAGSNNTWSWATAIIKGDTVIVSSASVAAPTQVLYAWSDNPIANLINKEGLPASSFRTSTTQLPISSSSSTAVSSSQIVSSSSIRISSSSVAVSSSNVAQSSNTILSSVSVAPSSSSSAQGLSSSVTVAILTSTNSAPAIRGEFRDNLLVLTNNPQGSVLVHIYSVQGTLLTTLETSEPQVNCGALSRGFYWIEVVSPFRKLGVFGVQKF